MLAALLDGARVYAHRAEKGPVYLCPGCQAELTLKKGAVKIHHFAHKPPVECQFGAGESAEHLEAKLALYEAFRPRAHRIEMEWPVESLSGDRRADVFVWDMAGGKIAIEIQHTDISSDLISQRSAAYMRAGIAPLWLPVLKSKWRAQTRRGSGGEEGDWLIPLYDPKPHEYWLRIFGYGVIWYWAPRAKGLMRGKIEDMLEKVENPFIGGPQEQRIGMQLRLWGPYDPASLSLRTGTRKQMETARHWVPGGPVVTLTSPAAAGA